MLHTNKTTQTIEDRKIDTGKIVYLWVILLFISYMFTLCSSTNIVTLPH